MPILCEQVSLNQTGFKLTSAVIYIKQVTEICIFMGFPWPSFALYSLWTGRQEIGMLIMGHEDHNGNDLNGFIVLSQIGFNWIMDIL